MSGFYKKKNWVIIPVFLWVCIYVLQTGWAHRKVRSISKVEKVTLTEETDYSTFFQQTGLGKSAVDTLVQNGEWKKVESIQDAFLKKDDIECKAVLGWFTRSDRIDENQSAPLVDLYPGDILLSFSTHSLGWRHGHVGLVVDEEHVLECTSWGKESRIVKSKHWRKYSNYAVLRVRDSTADEQQQVAKYAKTYLQGVPYHLSAGFLGTKAPETTTAYFGLQCAYLVWYAWQTLGYDLDSDGGRLVTAKDIWESDLLEIIQVYGMELGGTTWNY